MRCVAFAVIFVSVFFNSWAFAINKCVDGKGRINFTDLPCGADAATAESLVASGEIGGSIRQSDLIMVDSIYRPDVARMLNKLAQQHPACRERIDPASAGASSRDAGYDPSFFVQCGDENTPEVVRFSLAAARAGVLPAIKSPIAERAALQVCEREAKARALNPGTVDFSRILDANFRAIANGNSIFSSTFTAQNAFGVETRFFISCQFEGERLSGVSVKPFE